MVGKVNISIYGVFVLGGVGGEGEDLVVNLGIDDWWTRIKA